MQIDTLANCVYNLRGETGHSLSTTQGQNNVDTLKYVLKRAQQELWTAYQWPTMLFSYNLQTVAGQDIYTFPMLLQFEDIRKTFIAASTASPWCEGFEYRQDMEELLNGDGSSSQSGDGPQFWRPYNDGTGLFPNQFRIWPKPVTGNYWMRFRAMRPLGPFNADTDLSTLDAMTIVLFSAAEILARAKAEDAPTKLKKAQAHLLAVLGNTTSAKRRIATLGSSARRYRPVPGIDYIPQTG